MGSLFSLTLIILSWASSTSIKAEAQGISSDRLLDLYIRDYTFQAHEQHLIRTGILHTVRLPANFSGIRVDMLRLRCGSLRRYGAQVREFHLDVGVTVHPCVERVVVIRQNLGYNWSSIFYANYDISGYQLVSPILGLLAYNAGSNMNFSNPYELGILAEEKPITVDFSNTTKLTNMQGNRPYCASFESDGKVTLANQVSPYVCVAKRHGHFGLVIEMAPEQLRKKISRWKLVVGSSVGAALGAFLLGLLLVALLVKGKKKSRMEEMERRAYEDEALQVSMVGHVRAPTAAVTRTLPTTIEHEYVPSPQEIAHFCL
ncbi:hypothetical protein F2P56_020601 [Juglans regia]|uniref:Uncharacterized protein n=2 Tax=Juglans regia TaxID=51240 RepID=A0A833UW68_JUGRE|nr:uncharacterized protein LOC108990848 [Juglans regia]KAF5460755.1 hypothetical protein F2P56_020601 [Juglans regia]